MIGYLYNFTNIQTIYCKSYILGK